MVSEFLKPQVWRHKHPTYLPSTGRRRLLRPDQHRALGHAAVLRALHRRGAVPGAIPARRGALRDGPHPLAVPAPGPSSHPPSVLSNWHLFFLNFQGSFVALQPIFSVRLNSFFGTLSASCVIYFGPIFFQDGPWFPHNSPTWSKCPVVSCELGGWLLFSVGSGLVKKILDVSCCLRIVEGWRPVSDPRQRRTSAAQVAPVPNRM